MFCWLVGWLVVLVVWLVVVVNGCLIRWYFMPKSSRFQVGPFGHEAKTPHPDTPLVAALEDILQ